MKRKQFGQQHNFHRHDRHASPGDFAIKRQQRACENIALGGAALLQYSRAGALHMWRVDIVADHFEREIGFDAGAHIERAVLEQRPAAVRALRATQIIGDFAIEHGVDGLVAVVAHQHVFGGNRAICLKLEAPVTIALAKRQERVLRAINAFI